MSTAPCSPPVSATAAVPEPSASTSAGCYTKNNKTPDSESPANTGRAFSVLYRLPPLRYLRPKKAMITDNMIKNQFIMEQLKDAAESAFKFQLNSFLANRKSRSGRTLDTLSNPNYTITGSGDTFLLTSSVTQQLRFQDFGFRGLYNRPLFGALRYAYAHLKYGLRDEIKEQIHEQLQTALNP
jgi:hypothetical protein